MPLTNFEDGAMTRVKRLDPIPPGEILLEEFMRPKGISQNRLARDLDVNPARVNDIVHGRSAITAPLTLRLAKYFGTTPELWITCRAPTNCAAPARPPARRDFGANVRLDHLRNVELDGRH